MRPQHSGAHVTQQGFLRGGGAIPSQQQKNQHHCLLFQKIEGDEKRFKRAFSPVPLCPSPVWKQRGKPLAATRARQQQQKWPTLNLTRQTGSQKAASWNDHKRLFTVRPVAVTSVVMVTTVRRLDARHCIIELSSLRTSLSTDS